MTLKLMDARSFIERLESESPETYRRLLALIREPHSWFNGYCDFVAHLLSNHNPNLILHFNALLPDAYKIVPDRRPPHQLAPPPTTPPAFYDVIDFVNMLKVRFRRNEGLYESFLHTVKNHANDSDGYAAAWPELVHLFRHHQDVLDPLRKILFGTVSPPEVDIDGKKYSGKRKRSPEHGEAEPPAAKRRNGDHGVDYGDRDKHWRWEEERFEMDMLGSYLKSTVEAAKACLELVEMGDDGDLGMVMEMKLETHFTIHQRRTIEKLYARDHCLEAMEALRRNPRRNLPVVLRRLEQKLEKWKRDSQSMRKIGT